MIAVTGTVERHQLSGSLHRSFQKPGFALGLCQTLVVLMHFPQYPDEPITDPRQLASWLRRLEESGCSHAVVEVSSQLLAKHALAGVTCDTIAVTNLGGAHLDLHGTTSAYHSVKSRILQAASSDGAVVNSDDPRSQRLVERYRTECSGRLFTAGLKHTATVSATAVERSLAGQTLLLRCDGVVMPVSLDVPITSPHEIQYWQQLLQCGIGCQQKKLPGALSRFGVSLGESPVVIEDKTLPCLLTALEWAFPCKHTVEFTAAEQGPASCPC